MGLQRRLARAVLTLFLCLFSIPPFAAAAAEPRADPRAEPRFQVRISATFETGDFGTGTTTNTLFVPFTLRYLGDRFDLRVTVPFIAQESSAAVTVIDGRPEPVEKKGEPEEAIRRTAAGLGDVVVKGRYYLTNDSGIVPAISPFARVKFPTADEDEGLGTGELDYGFGVELDKKVGRAGLFADVGYTVRGDPPGLDLRNQVSYGGGLSYDFTRATTGSVALEGRTAAVSGRDDPLDLFFDLAYRLTRVTTLTGGVSFGLSNGSPDFGVTIGTSHKF